MFLSCRKTKTVNNVCLNTDYNFLIFIHKLINKINNYLTYNNISIYIKKKIVYFIHVYCIPMGILFTTILYNIKTTKNYLIN